jgi:hypothetical protein
LQPTVGNLLPPSQLMSRGLRSLIYAALGCKTPVSLQKEFPAASAA